MSFLYWKKITSYVLCLCAVSIFVFQATSITPDRSYRGYGTIDLAVFYVAGQSILGTTSVKAPAIYSKALKTPIRQIRPHLGGTKFLYPPQAAILCAPLALLPFTVLAPLWLWINTALVIACYYGIIRWWIGDRQLLRWRYSFLLGFLSSTIPLSGLFRTGQINGVLLLLLAVTMITSLYHKHITSGVCLAIATALKIFPVLFVLWFVVNKQWRALIAFLATSCALWLATVPWFGWLGLYRFWQFPFSLLMQGNINNTYDSISLYGISRAVIRSGWWAQFGLTKLEATHISNICFTALTLIAVVGLGIALWKIARARHLAKSEAAILAYSAIMLVFLLCTKSIHVQYALWLLPLYMLWVARANKNQIWYIVAAVFGLLLTQGSQLLPGLYDLFWHRAQTIGVVGTAIILLASIVNQTRPSTRPVPLPTNTVHD
jgi:hypothetical protein